MMNEPSKGHLKKEAESETPAQIPPSKTIDEDLREIFVEITDDQVSEFLDENCRSTEGLSSESLVDAVNFLRRYSGERGSFRNALQDLSKRDKVHADAVVTAGFNYLSTVDEILYQLENLTHDMAVFKWRIRGLTGQVSHLADMLEEEVDELRRERNT